LYRALVFPETLWDGFVDLIGVTVCAGASIAKFLVLEAHSDAKRLLSD
jgi:hypothetical protein